MFQVCSPFFRLYRHAVFSWGLRNIIVETTIIPRESNGVQRPSSGIPERTIIGISVGMSIFGLTIGVVVAIIYSRRRRGRQRYNNIKETLPENYTPRSPLREIGMVVCAYSKTP